MHGQMPRRYVDLCLDNPEDRKIYDSLPAYAIEVKERLDDAYAIVRDNIAATADRNSFWYNKQVKERLFEPNDCSHLHPTSCPW